MSKKVINPEGLFNSLQYGFSQIVVSQGQKMVHLSGQVGWDASEAIAGAGDLGQQTEKALQNLQLAMQTAGGTLADIVSLRIYIHVSVIDATTPIKEQLLRFFPQDPPAATWIGVPALADPAFLVEIEAVAVLD